MSEQLVERHPPMPSHRLEGPPADWTYAGARYTFEPAGPEAWTVSDGAHVVGVLAVLHPRIEGDALRWAVRHPERTNLGAAVTWMHWQDAVADLVDFQR